MDRILAFISYSSKEKEICGKFRSYLSNFCGYQIFTAHDDIPGSSVWEEEIIKAIENCDLFIPLISREFITSDYANQETGIAYYLKKKIIPIKLESVNPYGFINKYQALQYKKNPAGYYYEHNINNLAVSIAQIGMSYDSDSKFNIKAINSIVYAFCNSNSFNTSNAVISSMIKCKNFSRSQINLIVKAIQLNSQIQGAYNLPVLKKFLSTNYKIVID